MVPYTWNASFNYHFSTINEMPNWYFLRMRHAMLLLLPLVIIWKTKQQKNQT
jgi:hypothetical protein